eukprot:scaffold80276_cov62-Phaeocystis_antarctica.AAC.5
MPDSKRFRKYPEHDASATRWALNSTPSALTAKSVSRSSRQRATSEAWCGTPPLSVSLGAAAVVGCEVEDEAAAAAAVRARFFGGMDGGAEVWEGRQPTTKMLIQQQNAQQNARTAERLGLLNFSSPLTLVALH